VTVDELEVVWPLHRHHDLTAHRIDERADMAAEDSEPAPVSTGRDLAARTLVACANCTQQRAGEPGSRLPAAALVVRSSGGGRRPAESGRRH